MIFENSQIIYYHETTERASCLSISKGRILLPGDHAWPASIQGIILRTYACTHFIILRTDVICAFCLQLWSYKRKQMVCLYFIDFFKIK